MTLWHNLRNLSRIKSLPNQLGITKTMGGYFSTEPQEKKFVLESIQNDCVVIFSKTTCSYCRLAKSVFENIGAPYKAIELNYNENASGILFVLQDITGGSTVPRVFINGKFVGGGTDIRNLHREGKLLPLLAECNQTTATSAASSKL